MKRIITCSDGTWNKPGNLDRGVQVLTNVEKIYFFIPSSDAKGIRQVKYYDQGVGSGYSIKDKIWGGATGAGIDKNIKDAYKFIMWNYEPGDEIYLFGFSRGAYTARSIAGFIRNCGVLKSEYLHLIDEAYELYREKTSITSPVSDYMMSFKQKYSLQPRIKFIGVWDTVGCLGIPLHFFELTNKGRYEFHDVTLSSMIDNAFHALAIDEKRSVFEPAVWEKSLTVKLNPDFPQTMEQVWFPGVHSNIGGGYADTGLSDLALDWMTLKAKQTGLEIDASLGNSYDPVISVNGAYKGELRNSVTGFYKMMHASWRKIGVKDNRNEKIHIAAINRHKEDKRYTPENLLKVLEKMPVYDPVEDVQASPAMS